MSILSEVRLLEKLYDKEISIDPFVFDHIQPSSVDLTLNSKIKVPKKGYSEILNIFDEVSEDIFEEVSLDRYTLEPGAFVLAQIKETIGISKRYMGQIHNRNSLIRLGINVGLSTYINPGYCGKLPIVINNIGNFEIQLVPGMRICQLVVYDVEPESQRGYNERKDAKYFGELDISLSKLHLDSEFIDYLTLYNKEHRNKINTKDLMLFFEKRLKQKSIKILDTLSPEERRSVGLK
ncbi:MAG: dCTP deaminase [wastewater metagenome]|nr:dCTP deaminase [Candidatus Loosdrechtia aerotolerans]